MKNNKYRLRRLVALALTLAMCLSVTLPALAEGTMKEALIASMADTAKASLQVGDTDIGMYANSRKVDAYKATPSSFDLRDYDFVPPVTNQGNWGTCWGFASIGACEISILAKLNLTCAEYIGKYGKALDLSEKHLAWFGTSHLPELVEGESYIYPTLESQAGEGLWLRDEEELGQAARYNHGGLPMVASGIFAAGMGPVYEEDYPYAGRNGSSSTAADWTIDEEDRFQLAFELKNSSILPSPSMRDENGKYIYNGYGTAAIKDELLNGRAVTIGYHADQAMNPEALMNMAIDQLTNMLDLSGEDVEFMRALFTGELDMSSLTVEQNVLMMKIALVSMGADPSTIDDAELAESIANADNAQEESSMTDEETQAYFENMLDADSTDADAESDNEARAEEARAKAAEMGIDYDKYLEEFNRIIEVSEQQYVNTETYAQYTYDQDAMVTHAVTIVGWDDDYSASNFLEGHQPPADGAWIVRNSWGASYGNDGYFYLSYFDKTICLPESFDFVVSDIGKKTTQVDIMGYDYMEAGSVNSVQLKDQVATANIFDIASDYVIRYVSVLTADIDTDVSVAVYLLGENATSPVDGVMLDFVTTNYLYAGYHRIPLNHDYAVPAGSRISVVQLQRTSTANGETVSVVPYTISTGKKYMEAMNLFDLPDDYQTKGWTKGRIGQGESFVALDGIWMDWADVIGELQTTSNAATYLSYDNMNIKLYAYPIDEVKALHELSDPISFNGVQIQICDDCGYTLIEQ